MSMTADAVAKLLHHQDCRDVPLARLIGNQQLA